MTHADSQPMCLIDAHVHFHAREHVAPTLDAAAGNFRGFGAPEMGLLGLLLLTQTANELVFEFLRATTAEGEWRIAPARDEDETLVARRGADSIGIVCGRQLRTAEGLEVLALGTLARFPDRLSLDESIAAVRATDALIVLPWAFGKWTGRRGRRISETLEMSRAEWLFVGDNGGRLAIAGVPRLLKTAAHRGFRVLPGSDPFPFANDFHRVGAFGFSAETKPPPEAPWRAIRNWLQSTRAMPRAYGRSCGALRFITNQVGIRLRAKGLQGFSSASPGDE